MRKPIQADHDAAARWLGSLPNMQEVDERDLVQLLADHREPRFARTADLIATGIGQGMGLVFGLAISVAVYAWWTP